MEQSNGLVTNLSIQRFQLNTIGSDYVVGDIHGCLDQLNKQLHELKFNQDVDRLFCTGDLVDRGPDSIDVIKLLEQDWFHSVVGNHEFMLSFAPTDATLYNIHIANGAYWFALLDGTVKQYIVNLIHNKMPLIIEVETQSGLIGIVHGDLKDLIDWNTLYQDGFIDYDFQQNCLWGRYLFERSYYNPVPVIIDNIHKVYFGHSITPHGTPIVYGNCVFIDSGAISGKPLNIIKL